MVGLASVACEKYKSSLASFPLVKHFAVLCYVFLLIVHYWKIWSVGSCFSLSEMTNTNLIEREMIFFQIYRFIRQRSCMSNFN